MPKDGDTEAQIRLVVFGVALVAIATRQSVIGVGGEPVCGHKAQISAAVLAEAEAISDAVIAKARELDPDLPGRMTR